MRYVLKNDTKRHTRSKEVHVMDSKFRYKAFISYRHTSLDKKAAEKLQKKLESYTPPKGIRRQEKWKIFRDETELSSRSDLSEGIKDALKNAEFLIVICSSSTKESKWCLEEITYFKELNNGSTENIITLVVEGNPDDVFPAQLLTSSVQNPLTGEYEERAVEPLAANISAESEKASLKALDTEFLRIAAPMLSCGYDNLYLRDRRRRRRRMTALAAAIASVVLIFGIYSGLTLMKISSQNADLEQKNAELDVSNSNLREAYSNLDSANVELEKINASLDKTNLELEEKNGELDTANSELTKSNEALDSANSELTKSNVALDSANTLLEEKNSELDSANSELTKSNEALDTANAQLTKSNEALDKSNAELAQSNADLAKKTAEAEANLVEANKQKEAAQTNLAYAEEQRALAETNLAYAEEQREQAEENFAYAEEQRARAEENLRLYQEKNSELMVANAEIVAAKAEADFSDRYDRIGAVEEVLSSRPYEDDPYALLPSATRFLNSVLYSYSVSGDPRLQYTLDAEGAIADFSFSPQHRFICAYDAAQNVYVYDVVDGGKTVFKSFYKHLLNARVIDESRVVVVTYEKMFCVDFLNDSVVWSVSVSDLSRKDAQSISFSVFSSDSSRLAVWNSDGYFAFLETFSGTTLYSCKTVGFMDGFYIAGQINFSDGVHFSAVAFHNLSDSLTQTWLVTADLEKQKLSFLYTNVSGDTPFATGYADGFGYAVVEYVGDDASAYRYGTVLKLVGEDGVLRFTVPIYEAQLSEIEIKTVFTTEDVENSDTFIAVSAVRSTDKRAAVYFVNAATGEVIELCMPSAVKQVGYRGTSGWVSVYTAAGGQYHYNVYTGKCQLARTLKDSDELHADGSKKAVWVSNELAAALGESTTQIMLYQSGADENHETAVNEDSVTSDIVLMDENFLVTASGQKIYVYDADPKTQKYTVDTGFAVSDLVLFRSCAVTMNPSAGTLHFFSLKDGSETVVDVNGCFERSEDLTDHRWSLLSDESADRLTLMTLTGAVVFDGVNDFFTVSFEDRYSYPDSVNDPIALSPDGKKLIFETYDRAVSDVRRHYLSILSLDAGALYDVCQKDDIIFEDDYFRTEVAFSDDSALAAAVVDGDVLIVSADTGEILSSVSVGGRTPHTILFEPGGEKLLVMSEDFRLTEYDVSSGEELRSLLLPGEVEGVNSIRSSSIISRTLLSNPSRDEVVIYNPYYACFVSLDAFEVTCETPAESDISVKGFGMSSQELILQVKEELWFYPNYTVKELIARAEALVAERG